MHRTSLTLTGVLALALGLPASAGACENGVELELEPKVVQTASAERLLRSGHLRRSVQVAGRALRQLTPADRRLRHRVHRVLAVATVRLDGRIDRRRWRVIDRVEPVQRTENLRWAMARLREVAGESEAPLDRARLAESYVALGSHAQAVTILEELDRRDLMPDARAYASLAEAHHALGHRSERDAALRTCRSMVDRSRRGICPAFGNS